MHIVCALLLHFVVHEHWPDLPISLRVTSLALGQSYDFPSAREVTLKIGVNKSYAPFEYHMIQNKTKHDKTVCIFYGL